MSVFAGPNFVKSGTVLALDFANTRSYPGSGTSVYDLSGGGNTATLVNSPTYSAGLMSFNGTNSYVDIPFNASTFPTGTAARTLMAFFRTTTAKGEHIFGMGGNVNNGERISLRLTSGGAITVECKGGAQYALNAYTTNTWYHVAATVPASATVSQIALYINGVAVTGLSLVGSNISVNTVNTSCVVGAMPGSTSSELFAGQISSPTLYNRVLSATEVMQNFQAHRGRYGI